MITLYNTLTRQKKVLGPIESGRVKMYVCGPTVHNYIHIGNVKPTINYDVVRRYFECQGYNVEYVLNSTGIDDKLTKRPQELNQFVPEIAEKYTAAFREDVGALNVRKATSNPKVMDHMDDIIQFIKDLVDQGYAYEGDGDVYFRARKFEGYGKLSHQSIDDLKMGVCIDAGGHKEDVPDFILWEKAKPDEISWDSPFGEGRPGWHIECSVMTFHELGPTIDIHAGGSDLQFPHHESGIAQSEAHSHVPSANYWVHNGFINTDNEKMSKSLGNSILVHDIIKEVDPDVLRFSMTSIHYRSPISYNLELVEPVHSELGHIRNSYQLIEECAQIVTNIENQQTYIDQIDVILNRSGTVMNDDFNTANAITAWYDLAKLTDKYVLENTISTEVIDKSKAAYRIFSDVLGVPLKSKNADELLDEDIGKLTEEHNEARKNKDSARADEIRDMLKSQNIILEDTPQGVKFKHG